MMSEALALVHLAATLFMVGVIWFVQVVHYPLLARVAPGDVPAYEQEHTRRTGWVLAPVMLAELGTAAALLWLRTDLLPAAGFALLTLIWVSTWAVQVPCHDRLCEALDPAVLRRLVRSNWVRTVAWTARGAVAVALCRPS